MEETGPRLGDRTAVSRSAADLFAITNEIKGATKGNLVDVAQIQFCFAGDRQFELLQRRQQVFGGLQIGCIQAFHKLFEYRLQHSSRTIPLPLSRPQRRQVDRSAQFP